MIPANIIAIVKNIATAKGLDAALVCAIVEQESGGNAWAIRWEPEFYMRYIVPLKLADQTEETARAMSWGLMQVMGQVAREHGYMGALPALCDPATGIAVGCDVFNTKVDIASRSVSSPAGLVEKALLLWNGGGNPNYAAQVLARVPSYQS